MGNALLRRATKAAARQARIGDVDAHICSRIRERRIMLGLTIKQFAELIGVSYSKARKRDGGISRVPVAELLTIGNSLGVDITYFFDGLYTNELFRPTLQQRLLLELARNFVSIPTRRDQETLMNLARSLASSEQIQDSDSETEYQDQIGGGGQQTSDDNSRSRIGQIKRPAARPSASMDLSRIGESITRLLSDNHKQALKATKYGAV